MFVVFEKKKLLQYKKSTIILALLPLLSINSKKQLRGILMDNIISKLKKIDNISDKEIYDYIEFILKQIKKAG